MQSNAITQQSFPSHSPFAHIYFHFPFCEAKCHYCDFYSLAESKVSENVRRGVFDSIVLDAQQLSPYFSPQMKTIFLGGGTPSLVPLEALAKCVEPLNISRLSEAEITMEANPSSISLEKAKNWKKLGINRISMGVQALNDERLLWLGRVHDKKGIFSALESLFDAGIQRVNIDYILGVPGQTTQHIRNELSELLDRFPRILHISAYLLTLHDSNPKSQFLPNEQEQLDHLLFAASFLKERGFHQYEISNFAQKGEQSRHNENYWRGRGYLGIGPSAHSYWPELRMRTKNWSRLEKQESPWEWSEVLTPEQERIEFLMLGLRCAEGISFTEYKERFHQDLRSLKVETLDKMCLEGLCKIEEDTLSLTTRGLFLSDKILSNII